MSAPEPASDVRRRLLIELYRDDGEQAAVRLEEVLARHRRAAPPEVDRTPLWSHHDVWLITYADQFRRHGQTPLQTLAHVVDGVLDDVCNGVHILPFYPSTSDDGFSVSDHRSVDPAHGDWDDIARLATSKRLMFDAVINHASARGDWFAGFLAGIEPWDTFFRTEDPDTDLSRVVRPRTDPLLTEVMTGTGPKWVWTTFSSDQVDLDYAQPAVLLEVVDILLEYTQRGASALRLDAIGFLWKDPTRSSIHLPETHTAIQVIRSCLDEVSGSTLLISETNVPHDENISYLNHDPREVHAVYQFPLAPLVANAALTGDVTTLVEWARGVDELVDDRHTFLNFLGSHDGIGLRPVEGLLTDAEVGALVAACVRVGGEVSYRDVGGGRRSPYELNTTWFDLMSDGVDEATAIARHLATHAVMLALPGIAAVYVHSLFGSSNDRTALERTGRNRSLNRATFHDTDALLDELTDVAGRPRRVLSGMRRLAARRRSSQAFDPGGRVTVTSPVPGVVVIDRRNGGHRARCIVNLGPSSAELDAVGWVPTDDRPVGAVIEAYDARWLVPAGDRS